MTLARTLAAGVRGEIVERAPLDRLTTIRLGGPADLLFRPTGTDDLVAALRIFRDQGASPWLLGGGANTLVGDRGVRQPVVQLADGFDGEEWPAEDEVVLGAAVAGMRALRAARKRGLVGPEFLVGIPGTLGGQVAMNAGTRHGEVSSLLVAAEIATADGAGWLPAKELDFGYRRCRLPPGGVVVRARLRLSRGDVAAADAGVQEDLAYRRRTQPWDQPNLGSTFQNPPGDHAGRLLEAAGLKGHRIGGVAFSDRHANFLVNLAPGAARAADAQALVELAMARLHERFGVSLEPEIRRVGEF